MGAASGDASADDGFRHAAVSLRGLPTVVWGPWGGPLIPLSASKRRAGLESALQREIHQLKEELKHAQQELRHQLEAAANSRSEMLRRDTVNEELRLQRAREARSRVQLAEKRASDEILFERAKSESEMRKCLLKIALMERQIAGNEYVEMSIHNGMQHR